MKVRPLLDPVPLPTELKPPECYMTCDPGQWDPMLAAAYNAGWTLLEIEEVNGEQKAVRAWRKTGN